jgi:hypothetical protein
MQAAMVSAKLIQILLFDPPPWRGPVGMLME